MNTTKEAIRDRKKKALTLRYHRYAMLIRPRLAMWKHRYKCKGPRHYATMGGMKPKARSVCGCSKWLENEFRESGVGTAFRPF